MDNITKNFLDKKNIYNTYNQDKQYKVILFKANKIIQSQELVDSQLTIRDDMNSVISKLVQQASILEGGILSYTNTTINLSKTILYYNSYSIEIPEKVYNLADVLNSTLVIKINLEVVDCVKDSLLLDKHPKSRNANVEGADRIKITGSWELESNVSSNDTFFKIFILKNGYVQNTHNLTFLDKPEYLRKYDFTTNGNYVVEGFDILYKNIEKTNFILNNNFLSWSQDTYSVSANKDEQTLSNWFVKTNLSSIDVSKQSFLLTQTDVPNLPLFYSKFKINDSLSIPQIYTKIDDVKNLSYKTVIIKGYAFANKSVNIKLSLLQNFGIGGSNEVLKIVGNKVINTSWTYFEFTTLVPNVSGRIILDQSYLSLIFENNIAEAYEINFANISIENQYYDKGDFYTFSIREGIANVNGTEILLTSNKEFKLPVSTDTITISGEPYTFVPNTTYQLHKTNTREIIQIFGQKEITENVTHGNYIDAPDILPHTPVYSVSLVKQGATTYVPNIDYTLTGDTINWIAAGSNPAANSTYQVTYRYIDYNIQYSYNIYNNTFTVSDSLVLNTNFYVNYNIIIPRYDRIVLNKYGEISTIIGNPNFDKTYAYISIDKGLHLADIEINYNVDPIINLVYNRPYKLSDLNYLYNTIKSLNNDVLNLKLSSKSFNSLYTNSNADIEHNDTFLDTNSLRSSNTTCDIYKGICTSQVSYITNSINHDKNIIPFEAIVETSNIDLLNSYLEINSILTSTDKIAYATLDKYEFKWFSNTSKKILFKDEEVIRDYQTFGKITSELNPQFNLTITGWGYGNAEFIEILFDHDVIDTFICQPNGEFIHTTNIQANTLKSGKRKLSIRGVVSKREFITNFNLTSTDNLSHINDYLTISTKESIDNTYVISNLLLNKVNYTNSNWVWKGNPIFQKFVFNSDILIKDLDIFIKHSDSDVICYVAECTAGIPDPNKVISTGYLKLVDITQNHSNKIKFRTPIFIDANKEYTVIISSSTNKFTIGTIDTTLNKALLNNNYKELYQSYNNSILLEVDKTQLALQINTFDFTPDAFNRNFVSVEQALTTINVSNITDFAVICGVKAFDGTSLSFKVILLDRNSETYTCEPFTNIYFKTYTGRIQLQAIFVSYNFKLSAYLDSYLVYCLGTLNVTSIYETIKVPFKGDRVTLALQLNKDTNSTITPQYWNGTSYIPLDYDSTRTVDLVDNEIRFYYKDTSTVMNETSLKILFQSLTNGGRPVVKNLRFWFNIPFGGSEYLKYTPSGDINSANGKVINLNNGVLSTDAINKGQLDAIQTSLLQTITTQISQLNSNLSTLVSNSINSQVDPKIATAKTEVALDYNTKINDLSGSVNTEFATQKTEIIDETNATLQTQIQATTQVFNTQLNTLQTNINTTIDQKITTASDTITTNVTNNVDSIVDTKVQLATNNLVGTLHADMDTKILADHILQAQEIQDALTNNNSTVLTSVTAQIQTAADTIASTVDTKFINTININKLNQFENQQSYKGYLGAADETINIFNLTNRIVYTLNIVQDDISSPTYATDPHSITIGLLTDALPNVNMDTNTAFTIFNASYNKTLTVNSDETGSTLITLPARALGYFYFDQYASTVTNYLYTVKELPSNLLHTNVDETISSKKTFNADIKFNNALLFEYSSNKFYLPGAIKYTQNQSTSSLYVLNPVATKDTIVLFDINTLFINKHIITSIYDKDFYLPKLSDFISYKTTYFTSNTNSFIFTLTNISNHIITLKTDGATDLIHFYLMDTGDQTSVVLQAKTSIELCFNFSDNILYEI